VTPTSVQSLAAGIVSATMNASLLAGLLVGSLAGSLAFPSRQGPVKPAPAPATPPAAQEAPAKEIPGKPEKHELEGVYVLKRRMSAAGQDARASRGYLAITGRHLFLCIAAEGADATTPLVHAGVRTWQPQQDRVRTTVLIGCLTNSDGAIKAEKPGHEELRRIEPMKGGLRVMQPDNRWLEFERVE
jgi:hypothetical protein